MERADNSGRSIAERDRMKKSLRRFLANMVCSFRPELFYYVADRNERRNISVKSSACYIDVIRTNEKKLIRINRSNAIYVSHMIDSFDYFFRSAMPTPVRMNGDFYDMIDFSTPRLHNVEGFSDFSVLCPSFTEPYSTTGQYLDFAELTNGSIVFDLGSYSGLTSIAFSKEVGADGKVIALEPDPMNFRSAQINLEANRRVNGLDNVTLLPHAISDSTGSIKLSSEGTMGSALVSIVGGYRGPTVDVACDTLQSLADRFELSRVDFIKMDVEGAELPVIKGSADFLKKYKPKMIIEPHPVDGIMTSDVIIPFLEGIGYDCLTIDQPGLSLPLVTARPRQG